MEAHPITGSPEPSTRRPIDMAIGVLVALRRCTEADAFAEIVHAVHATGVGPASITQALVTLASGAGEPFPYHREATSMWGDLLATAVATDHRG